MLRVLLLGRILLVTGEEALAIRRTFEGTLELSAVRCSGIELTLAGDIGVAAGCSTAGWT